MYHIFNKWKKPNIHFSNASKDFLKLKIIEKKKKNQERKVLADILKKALQNQVYLKSSSNFACTTFEI